MEITDVEIHLNDFCKYVAFAHITLDDCFVVRGLKIIRGSKYYISMPDRPFVAEAIDSKTQAQIESAIMAKYKEKLIQFIDFCNTTNADPPSQFGSLERSHLTRAMRDLKRINEEYETDNARIHPGK